jgi:predicted nucleic acid-binding protein
MIAVIDTSAFLRLFLPDGPVPEGLIEFFRGVERGDNLAVAPELLLAEAVNVANKKRLQGILNLEDAQELVALMRRVPIHYIAHASLVERALELAATHDLTVYDALFLALALQKPARLFTADKLLADIARKLGFLYQ